MGTSSITLISLFIFNSQITSILSAISSSTISCDPWDGSNGPGDKGPAGIGKGSHFDCINDGPINCLISTPCNVHCEEDIPNQNRRRTLLNVGDEACAGVIINCPVGAVCNIYCTYSCNGMIVNAQSSTVLNIYDCGEISGDCDDMEIHCPTHDGTATTATCIIGGSTGKTIDGLDIYAQEAFFDVDLSAIDLKDGSSLNKMHCGLLMNEHSCNINTANNDECFAISGGCTGYRLTDNPTTDPTKAPTDSTNNPSVSPTYNPTKTPTNPTNLPTNNPSISPTKHPTNMPSIAPTKNPTNTPSKTPTKNPTDIPSKIPTKNPTDIPSISPTDHPSKTPTKLPTNNPSKSPTKQPTDTPTNPTISPTNNPSYNPSITPTQTPSIYPTKAPTINPTKAPTINPTATGANLQTAEEKKGDISLLIMVGCVGGAALLLICCICCVVYYKKKQKQKYRFDEEKERDKTKYELNHTIPASPSPHLAHRAVPTKSFNHDTNHLMTEMVLAEMNEKPQVMSVDSDDNIGKDIIMMENNHETAGFDNVGVDEFVVTDTKNINSTPMGDTPNGDELGETSDDDADDGDDYDTGTEDEGTSISNNRQQTHGFIGDDDEEHVGRDYDDDDVIDTAGYVGNDINYNTVQ